MIAVDAEGLNRVFPGDEAFARLVANTEAQRTRFER